MKLYCNDFFSKKHDKINLSNDISCCLGLLLEKYDESELYSLQKSYAGFLVRTINHYLKAIDYNIDNDQNFFFENITDINIIFIGKLIDIITHYSIILIQHNKYDYVKIICSVGIDLINFSKYKYEKNIIRKKNFLLNNLSCIYLYEKRYYKSKIFLDKCFEINKSTLDIIITYNNYYMTYIKKLKNNINKNKKEEIKTIIDNIIYYIHMELKEIKKRINNKYKNELKLKDKNVIMIKYKDKFFIKKEITCFLLYNCFYVMKFFDVKEFEKNYNKGLKIIQKLIGREHHITIKMIRIKKNKNNGGDDDNGSVGGDNKKYIEDILKNNINNDIGDNDSSLEI